MEGSSGFHPFRKPCLSSLSLLLYEMNLVTRDIRSKRIFGLMVVNVISALVVMAWTVSSNSLCLSVCSTILLVDFLSLLTCLLGFWVEQKKPNKIFTFGHIRIEILTVFVITIVALISSLLSFKEGISRFSNPPEVTLVHVIPGILLCMVAHIIVKVMNDKGKAFTHVFTFAPSNFIQEYFAKISRSICQNIPGFSAILLPRLNPLTIFLSFGAFNILIISILEEFGDATFCDTLFGIMTSILLMICVLPLTSFTGHILLQTTPVHMIGHLDKCLREASTHEGILEFRNEHFWTLGYNNLVGSIHVRVRRDANEQVVLSHLTNRLSNLVSDLTIQVFKDEWTWQSSPRLLLQHHKPASDHSSFLKYNTPSASDHSSLLKYNMPSMSSTMNSLATTSVNTIHSTSSDNSSGISSPSTSIPFTSGASERNQPQQYFNHDTSEWVQNV